MIWTLKAQLVLDAFLVGLGAFVGQATTGGLIPTTIGAVGGALISAVIQYEEANPAPVTQAKTA
jgi:hypothetical protein